MPTQSTCLNLARYASSSNAASDGQSLQEERRDGVVASVMAAAVRIAAQRGVRHTVQLINKDPPATCSAEVRVATACGQYCVLVPCMLRALFRYSESPEQAVCRRIPTSTAWKQVHGTSQVVQSGQI